MEALGTQAGCIAHDCKNLTPVILGYGDLLILNADKQAPNFPGVREVREAPARASELVNYVLTSSRTVQTNIRPFNSKHEVKQEALEEYKGDRSRISLAIMDLNMPACTGSDALKSYSKSTPNSRSLLPADLP